MRRGRDFVYTLIDPRDWMVKYIGITDNPKTRFSQHIHSHEDRYNPEKTLWIQGIKSEGYLPLMVIVESNLTRAQAIDLEMRMIYEFLEQGMALFNVDRRRPFSHWTESEYSDSPIAGYKIMPMGKSVYGVVGIVDEKKCTYRLLDNHRVYGYDYAWFKCKKLNQSLAG